MTIPATVADVDDKTKVAACQVPEIRGDVEQALWWIETHAAHAESQEARLVCFPECFLQGYLVDEQQARGHAIDLGSHEFEGVLGRLATSNLLWCSA